MVVGREKNISATVTQSSYLLESFWPTDSGAASIGPLVFASYTEGKEMNRANRMLCRYSLAGMFYKTCLSMEGSSDLCTLVRKWHISLALN